MERNPLISVVIPVKNGAKWLRDLLQSLERQSLAEKTEIIFIDSGSDDESVEIIKQHDVRLINISPQEFNHGLTRNLGAHEAKGDYVVMTVQDARPADDNWLQKLLDGFVDEKIAGVCGQQIVPHDADKNPVQWFNPQSEPRLEIYEFDTAKEFDALPPERKKQICGWDDVTACYRRDALLKVPFREITFAEDAAWAMDALRAGYKIAYNKIARVYHYHHETPDFALRRSLIVYYSRYKLFGYIPEKPLLTLRKKLSIVRILMKTNIGLDKKRYWWRYNINLFKSQSEAYEIFMRAFRKGSEALEEMFVKHCTRIPIASEATKNK